MKGTQLGCKKAHIYIYISVTGRAHKREAHKEQEWIGLEEKIGDHPTMRNKKLTT